MVTEVEVAAVVRNHVDVIAVVKNAAVMVVDLEDMADLVDQEIVHLIYSYQLFYSFVMVQVLETVVTSGVEIYLADAANMNQKGEKILSKLKDCREKK